MAHHENSNTSRRARVLRAAAPLGAIALLALVVAQSPPEGRLALAALDKLSSFFKATGQSPIWLLLFIAWAVCGTALLVVVVWLLAAYFGKKARKTEGRVMVKKGESQVAGLALMTALFTATGLVLRLFYVRGKRWEEELRFAGGTGEAAAPIEGMAAAAEGASQAQAAPPSAVAPGALTWLASILALAAAASIVVLALRLVKARRGAPSAREPEAAGADEVIAQGLARARHRLSLGDEARDAIVGCYADMCALYFTADASAAETMTPREFRAELLARGIDGQAVTELTGLFEKARYSSEPCGRSDVEAAVAALLVLERGVGERGDERRGEGA